MRDLIDANLDVIDSWDKTKLTSDELKTKIADQKQAFIDQMVQLGYSREEVEKYAGVFDQIPTDLPLDIPITVHDQEVKDAKAEAGHLAGALKALEEPAKIAVDDEAARVTGETWLKDATESYFVPHTVGVAADDEEARAVGERWLDDATNEYFVPHTVEADADDSVARGVGSAWLNDATHHYFVPHTVDADADDSVARAKGIAWRDFANAIFGDRTVHVDVDVDIPWGDLQWLEDHLPQGPGGREAPPPQGMGDDGGRGSGIGSQGISDMQFSVPVGDGGRGMGGSAGATTTINKTANIHVVNPVAERTSDDLGRKADMILATL
jgi:hypothetical protein